jgi:molybdopterin-guanine dinucleotide biosynthesis protein B
VTPILAFSGPSGAGKTRLLALLLPELRRRGLTVGVLKRSGHPHDFDQPGKDTEVLRRAGAVAAVISGPSGVAFFGPPVEGARALARLLPPVDLVLAEGFKSEPLPRVEVHRRRVSREFLCARDRRVVAVVGDEAPPRELPWFGPDDLAAVADFVEAWLAVARGRPVTVREAGRLGGERTRATQGEGFYTEIGRAGGKAGGPRGGKKGGAKVRLLVAAGKKREARERKR